MAELWQLYIEQGRPLAGQGARRDEVGRKGLLHAAAHVWLWRRRHGDVELLLQKRAAGILTWPGRLDISAAGHVDLGEEPLRTAVRETREELGLSLAAEDLRLIGVTRARARVDDSKLIENEFQWVYLAKAPDDALHLEADETAAVTWKRLAQLQAELADPALRVRYVPHGPIYFAMLFDALEML